MPMNINGNKLKFLSFIAALIFIWYLGRYVHIESDRIEGYLRGFPVILSGGIFILLYVVVTFFIWFSKDVFRLVAAILFGPFLSTLLVFLAEVINAFILFYFARYLGRSFVEDYFKLKKNGLDEKLGKLNFFWLFLFRAVPLIPFRFLDLASGLTRLSFKRYITVVILGSPLRIFWLQYIIYAVGKNLLKDPYAIAEYLLGKPSVFIFSLIYLILAVIVSLKLKNKE